LDGKDYSSSEEIKKQSQEAIQQARKASSTLKKSFIERVKDLPVVQKVSELGTAGSVAVSTAAIAQTNVAVDQTEVFVASVANDVIEERIEAPMFIDTFVDFHTLNDWGQVVMAEKIEVAQDFVQKAETIAASAPSPSQSESSASPDPKPSSSEPSPSAKTDGQSEQKPSEEKSEKQSEKEAKAEEKDPSEKTKDNDSEKDKEDNKEQGPKEKTEDKQPSQKSNTSSEPSTDSRGVNALPIIETPIDMNDSSIRQVSPIM
jgi:outer membrane biosynthesis protein TonB